MQLGNIYTKPLEEIAHWADWNGNRCIEIEDGKKREKDQNDS